MPDQVPYQMTNGLQCNEFDALLTDALDGVLIGISLDRFQAHARICPVCGPLFAEADAGRTWLKGLTEVEPPVGLITNILAATTGVDTQRLRINAAGSQPAVSWLERAQAWLSASMQPIWGTVRQPRFAMSFGMAFFSLSVALTVAGVKPTDLRQVSLRPAAIRHTYYSTQARVVRYYENIRFVYEVESRVRELKRTVTPAEPGSRGSGSGGGGTGGGGTDSEPTKQNERKNDTSHEPQQKQERNYSQTESHIILAGVPVRSPVGDLSVVPVTTYRRLV